MKTQTTQQMFYAIYEEVVTEIAVFHTEEDRDRWVKFQDWFSILTNTTGENSAFQRVALSSTEATAIAGDMLHLPELFTEDPILDNVEWLIIF